MANDVVRYNNGLNAVPLRKFTPNEMDIFWSICSKMKRRGTNPEVFDFNTFKQMAHYDRREKDKFYSALKSTWDKLKGLSFVYEDEHIYREMLLFQAFEIDKDNETVLIQTSSRFEYILNAIGSDFTRFELENMTRIKSSYVKEFYRQLMSHRDGNRKKGAWYVKVEDFRVILSVPDSYRMRDIDKQILNQAKKEFLLPTENDVPILSKLTIEKVKASKGNKISSFRFYWEESNNVPSVTLHNWLEDDA